MRAEMTLEGWKTLPMKSLAPDGKGGCYALDEKGRLWWGHWVLAGGTNNEWAWDRLPGIVSDLQ